MKRINNFKDFLYESEINEISTATAAISGGQHKRKVPKAEDEDDSPDKFYLTIITADSISGKSNKVNGELVDVEMEKYKEKEQKTGFFAKLAKKIVGEDPKGFIKFKFDCNLKTNKPTYFLLFLVKIKDNWKWKSETCTEDGSSTINANFPHLEAAEKFIDYVFKHSKWKDEFKKTFGDDIEMDLRKDLIGE